MYNDNTFNGLFTGTLSGGVYTYPSAEQNLVVKFADFYLSAKDGDFTTDPVTITSETGEGEDISIGNAPAKVLTATMLNPDGAMDTLTWGDGSVYIGVETASASADTYSTYPVFVYGGTVRCGLNASGNMVRNSSTSTLGGTPVAVITNSNASDILYITTTKIGRYNGGFSTITTPTAEQAYLAAKFRAMPHSVGVLLDANGLPSVYNSVAEGTKQTFSYVPMGVFDCSGVDAYGITFGVEAYDKMTVFDADATEWWNAIDFDNGGSGRQLSWIAGELYTHYGFIGSPTISASAVNDSLVWNTNPITSYAVTGRDILKWLAEAMGCNARMGRTGGLEFWTFATEPVTTVATIYPDIIISNTRVKGKATVPKMTETICYNVLGAGYQVGSSGSPYYVVANPFIDPSGDLTSLTNINGLVTGIPAYYPNTISVACGDPRWDAGDFVTVQTTDGTSPYAVPIMHETLSWNGNCVTTLSATGKQVRDIPEGMNNTDLSSMVDSNPSAVVNKIQAVGIDADWITAGIISDRQGNNSWDLDTGVITMKNGALNTVYTLTYEAANYDQSDLDTVDDYLNGVITSLTTEEWEKYDFLGTRHLTSWNRNHIAQMIATGTDAVKTVTTNIDPHSSDNSIYSSIKVSAVGTSPQYTINGSLSAARLGATTTRSSYVDVFNGVTVHSDSYSGGRYNTYVQQNYIGLTDSTTTNSVTIRTDKMSATDGTNTTSMTGANATVTDGTNTTTQTATGITADNGTNTTTQTATGVTFDDGTASSKLSVIKRTMDSAGTTTVTLERGMYLAITTHTNNTTASQSGLAIVQAYDSNSSVLNIATAGNSTLTVSGLTLTWTTTNTYRALRLIKLT